MYLNQILELSIVLENEKFQKILTRNYNQTEYVDENKQVDRTLDNKGIIVMYHDNQYKKKIKITINPYVLLNGEKFNADKLVRKLEKQIAEYFDSKYQLDDFQLTGMFLMEDISIGKRGEMENYLKVIKRIGRVKGFSPSSYEYIDDCNGFCLDGNSNGITFMIYNLESFLANQIDEVKEKKRKEILEKSKAILRVEVRLTKPKAIRMYTDKTSTCNQLVELSEKKQDIFLDTFVHIIPFGDFHKKDKAIEIIQKEVKDIPLRRRMIRLVALIPEKKSLLLAQKELNYRRIDKVMDMFAAIDLSPVTLSKRHDVKYLENLYVYII